MPRPSLFERIQSAVVVDEATGCWNWTRHLYGYGYGHIYADGRSQMAHRVVYELFVGPIPDGLQLDHLCRNTACVNPAHLEPVTCRENILRGTGLPARRAVATHCIHGHAFDTANTYYRKTDGVRACRTCLRESMRRWRSARKAA